MFGTPSIGRIVHLRLTPRVAAQLGHDPNLPAAAVVTNVHEDGRLSLTAFPDSIVSTTYRAALVPQGDEPGTWSWPPRV